MVILLVLFLVFDTPAKKPIFPYRLVEGVKEINPSAQNKSSGNVQFALDGQQRITSLFYAFYEPNIPLKGTTNPYKFYLDIEELINDNLDDAVIGISKKNKKGMSEVEERIKKFEVISFCNLRQSEDFYEWLYEKQTKFTKVHKDRISEVYKHFSQFMLPVISLPAETEKNDIVNMFERINRTGINLSLFDLAVAQLYQRDIKLRDLWNDFIKKHDKYKDNPLSAIQPIFPLRVISLLEGKEIRKRDLLDAVDLQKDKFIERWTQAINALVMADQRITDKYGAFQEKWIPYPSLLVPLAVLLQKIEDNRASGYSDYTKVDFWYWGCVISGRYEKNVFSKMSEDLREITSWINNEDKPPQWLAQLSTSDLSLNTTDDPRSSLYRAIMNLVVCEGACDFLTGQKVIINQCQDDHIFPKSRYKDKSEINSILNRTLIFGKTNKRKKNKLPSEFFKDCLEKHEGDENKLLESLSTHFISHSAYIAIQNDDFDNFLQERQKTIESAVFKKLQITLDTKITAI